MASVLFNIVSDGVIKASTSKSGFIAGATPAVCFQDAPLASICQNVFYEQKYQESNKDTKTRYRGAGVSISKRYAYGKRARPVIYDKTADAKAYLPPDQWWRIVNFDLDNEKKIIDWTHEREWRVAHDFHFEISEVTLLFVNATVYRAFSKLCVEHEKDFLAKVKGVVVMDNLLY